MSPAQTVRFIQKYTQRAEREVRKLCAEQVWDMVANLIEDGRVPEADIRKIFDLRMLGFRSHVKNRDGL